MNGRSGFTKDLADEWFDDRVEAQVAQMLTSLHGHHALSADEIRLIRLSMRGVLAMRRARTVLRVVGSRNEAKYELDLWRSKV